MSKWSSVTSLFLGQSGIQTFLLVCSRISQSRRILGKEAYRLHCLKNQWCWILSLQGNHWAPISKLSLVTSLISVLFVSSSTLNTSVLWSSATWPTCVPTSSSNSLLRLCPSTCVPCLCLLCLRRVRLLHQVCHGGGQLLLRLWVAWQQDQGLWVRLRRVHLLH